MSDLQSKRWIVLKGILFLGLAGATGALVLLESPSWRAAFLLTVLVWSSCRFYYFLFYVLEKYVDPGLKYAGVFSQLRALARHRGRDDFGRLDRDT